MLGTPLLDALQRRLQGTVEVPGSSPGSEDGSARDGMADPRPAATVRALTTADVERSICFAREHGLSVAVRGGGRGVTGDRAGVVLDLEGMTAIRIDRVARLAHVQAGARWGLLDHAAQAYGLATTGGFDSRAVAAGETLHGGNGYLARAHGLAADNLVGATVVTADGRVVHANEVEHPDLFWALRGGGGKVGVVTSLVFRLHAVGPQVATIEAHYRLEEGPQVLAAHAEAVGVAPEAVSVRAIVGKIGPGRGLPDAFHGRTVITIVGMYAGSVAEADRDLEPFASLTGPPIAVTTMPMAYAEFQRREDRGTSRGVRLGGRPPLFSGLPVGAIEALLNHARDLPDAVATLGIEPMGGATARLAEDATSFGHRDASFALDIRSPRRDAASVAWAGALLDAMRPHACRPGPMDRRRLDRLAAVKREWDPTNVFPDRRDPVGGRSGHPAHRRHATPNATPNVMPNDQAQQAGERQ